MTDNDTFTPIHKKYDRQEPTYRFQDKQNETRFVYEPTKKITYLTYFKTN